MNRENTVLIDWLSVTSKIHSPQDIMTLVGFPDPASWQQIKGARGYKSRYWRDNISIHYAGGEDMGVWLELSGQGCRAFETYSHGDYDRIFSEVMANPEEMNITRLDVAFDEYTGILDIDRVCSDVVDHKYKSKADFWEVIQSATGKSAQIGAPSSKVLIRIYDKLAERLAKVREPAEREKIRETIPHWCRVELQLRDERAREFVKYLMAEDPVVDLKHALTLGQAYCSVLKNYLDFGYPTHARAHPDQEVWHTFPYWQAVLAGASALSIYRKPGIDYNLQRCTNYIQNIAGNAVDCLLNIYGVNGFVDLISKREISQNPKYRALMERVGTFEDSEAQIDRLLDLQAHEVKEKRISEMLAYFSESNKPLYLDGVRYLICEHCHTVAPATEFLTYGTNGKINVGFCKKCF